MNQFGTITIDEDNVLSYFDNNYFKNHTLAIEANDASSSNDVYTIDNITVSYPKYSNGWNILAIKNGTLTDLATNKNLYSLYYESE